MKKTTLVSTVGVVLCGAALCGCVRTQKARFYVLTPWQTDTAAEPNETLRTAVVILDRIRLPKYLERPTIATRVSDAEIDFSEFHRWAGTLENDLARVISLNLAEMLGTNSISDRITFIPKESDYHVAVQIISLIGTLGKEANLTAKYWLYQGEKANPQWVVKSYREKLATADYATYVSAQSKMLAELSRDIAQSLRETIRAIHWTEK